MLHSQEVIERSIYYAILNVLLQKGLTLNPSDYLPLSETNNARYESDRRAIEDSKGFYVELYGSSNSLSKGYKHTPRVVIIPQGFYPGDIGFERLSIDKSETEDFLVSELPFEAIDQNIDIRIVAGNIEKSRLLHSIVNSAIPQRGYIKPYTSTEKPFDGNIFIMLSNFFDSDNNEQGIIEKVYQFTVKDTLLEEIPVVDTLPPLTDIKLLMAIDNIGQQETELNSTT